MRFLTLSAMALVGLTAPALAQSRFQIGLRVGGNLASLTVPTVSYNSGFGPRLEVTSSPVLGWQAGVQADYRLGPQVSIQSALVLSQKGVAQTVDLSDLFGTGGQDHTHIDAVARPLYAELPLHVVVAPTQLRGVQLVVGPYVAVGVGGKAHLNYDVTNGDNSGLGVVPQSGSTDLTMRYGSSFPDLDTYSNGTTADFVAIAQARRFDAGLDVGAGYRRGPWQGQLIFSLGLTNSQPEYTDPGNGSGTINVGETSDAYHRVGQLVVSYFFGAQAAP